LHGSPRIDYNPPPLAYIVEYSPEAEDHLRHLTARQQRMVVDGVERQLLHQPAVETRNRKPMRPNPVAPWELRIGNLRVYYEIEEALDSKVVVLAIGIKIRDKIRIGREVVDL
jgi:mRNA-degrading endonuclease RelE of RelBE toxin-antitoxin system